MSDPIAPSVLRALVRASTLPLGLNSPAAEELLLMITAHETKCGAMGVVQSGGGPALGLWQMEPPTFNDVMTRIAPRRPEFLPTLRALAASSALDASMLRAQHAFAAAMARLQLFQFAEALPPPSDIVGMSRYAKSYWNRSGAATPELYEHAYRTLIL